MKTIYHPAWPGDKNHELWQRDAMGSNGMVSVSLSISPERARRFVNALQLFGIGFSWGGFESLVQLVSPAAIAGHSYWQDGDAVLLRFHIGLEDAEDLIADLSNAFVQSFETQ